MKRRPNNSARERTTPDNRWYGRSIEGGFPILGKRHLIPNLERTYPQKCNDRNSGFEICAISRSPPSWTTDPDFGAVSKKPHRNCDSPEQLNQALPTLSFTSQITLDICNRLWDNPAVQTQREFFYEARRSLPSGFNPRPDHRQPGARAP